MSEVTTKPPLTGEQAPGAGNEAARAPKLAPSVTPQKNTSPESAGEHGTKDPVLGFIVPESWIGKEFIKIGHEFNCYRDQTVHSLHPLLVNNSSNIIGTIQLIGEGFMFKASGNQLYQGSKIVDGIKKTDYFGGSFQNWLEQKHPSLAASKSTGFMAKALRAANPAIEPLHNIVHNVVVDAGFKIKPAELLRPGYYKERASSFIDLQKATELDRAMLAPGQKLINRWQTRATFLGMVGMSIAALMPDDKDKPEEVKNLAEMATLHPLQYAGHRVAVALNPLNWWDNKRAFVGFMMTLCGVSTFLAGFRNVSGKNEYFWNKAHGFNGLITATAGSQLILSPSADQGWARWGSIMWARMAFLPKSISARYEKKDPNANFYSMGQFTLQSSNVASFMFGGAEIKDGVVIDHKKITAEAKKLAKLEKEQHKLEKAEAKHHRPKDEHALADQLALQEHRALAEIGSSVPPTGVVDTKGATVISPDKASEIAA